LTGLAREYRRSKPCLVQDSAGPTRPSIMVDELNIIASSRTGERAGRWDPDSEVEAIRVCNASLVSRFKTRPYEPIIEEECEVDVYLCDG
jgi:hypothetical protein